MGLRVVIVGFGRMGKEIEALCSSYDCEVVERLDIHNNAQGEGIDPARLPHVDVAVDFSTPSATIDNLPRLAAAGIDAVIGTTGWSAEEARMREVVANAGIGVVVAANFSLGVNLFQGHRRTGRRAVHPARGLWCVDPRNAPRGQEGCSVRNRALP